MKIKFSFVILLCWVLIHLCLTSCGDDEGSISGKVISAATGEAIQNANIKLYPSGHSITTHSDGTFFFKDIKTGTYELSVVADGYDSYSQSVSVLENQTVKADIQLNISTQAVTVSPINLAFGETLKQMTFRIKNNTSHSLSYSISHYEPYLSVSPAYATVAAKSTQTVTTSVDRTKLSYSVSTTLTVNVGNNSYPVTISIDVAEEEVEPNLPLIGVKWYLQKCWIIDYYGYSHQSPWGDGEYIEFLSNGVMEWNRRLNGVNTKYRYTISGDRINCRCTWSSNNDDRTTTFRILEHTTNSLTLYDEGYDEGIYRYFER